MRRALVPSPATRAASFPINIPAPTGGLNTRDGRGVMPITDAEMMDNFFPEATDVRIRPGSDTYCSGVGSQVESILSYSGGATLRLLIAAGGTIQNITTVGITGTIAASSTVANGFTNDRWQYRNFGTPGGTFLVAVNGVNSRQIYNGTIMWAGTASAGAGTAAVYANIEIFQRRIFYAQANSLEFLYHDQVSAIGGTVSGFNLAPLLSKGGYLQAIGTWTRDGGSGMDDLIAFISSEGEIAVYQGIDPGDASSWSMIGVYKIPRPVGRRCTQKLGGELLIATVQGVVSLSAVMSGLEQQAPFSDKINTSLSAAWAIYKNNFGWEIKYDPDREWLILNIPVSTGNFQQQYVMNANSPVKPWTRFKDWSANCFEVHNGNLYFGTDGAVIQAATSAQSDDGEDILVDVRQAASTFGAPGRLKHFKLYRPLINSDGALGLAFAMDVDFNDMTPTNIPTVVAVAFAEWDVASWDDFDWGGDPVPVGQWQSAGALGTYGSIRIKGASNETAVRWYGTDVVLEPGGMI
jgi:hypothetical protein